jgi:hypothetical protein
MMPPHYALSDAFIVLVTIFAGNALRRNGQNLLAFSMACFVVRFAGGLQDELASLHSGASKYLGLVGTLAVASACVFRGGGRGDALKLGIILFVAGAGYVFARSLLAPFFILALVIAFITAIARPFSSQQKWLVPIGVVIMLANAIFIRRAAWLDEAVSWHLYHVLVALALAVLAKGMIVTERNMRKPLA